MQTYLHVFAYGRPDEQSRQRYAFRFCVLDPFRRNAKPGRPRKLATATCTGMLTVVQGIIQRREEVEPFYSAEEAALECDRWKFWLLKHKGARKLDFSLGSYDAVESAHQLSKYNCSIEDMEPSEFLKRFVAANEDALFILENTAESNGWDPNTELHEAEKRLQETRDNPENFSDEEKSRAHHIKDWARHYNTHMQTVAEVEAYGPRKLEAEIAVLVQALNNGLRHAAEWRRPEKPGFFFRPIIEKILEYRKQLKAALDAGTKLQAEINAFTQQLTTKTAELKNERLKI
jgi:hypothetical protein